MSSFAHPASAVDAPKAALSPPVHLPASSVPVNRSLVRFAVVSLEHWHLFSLDAPTVAMLWTWFLAKSNGIALPVTSILAMGVAVWLLYAADRLLDARGISGPTSASTSLSAGKNHGVSCDAASLRPDGLEPRHYFHRRHQRAFRFGIVIASTALAWLLPQLSPQAIQLYLALGVLLFGYFILIHLDTSGITVKTRRLPKELAVGVFFSAATFIPTVAREPSLRPALLPAALLFASLCSLNCLFIFAWEHSEISLRARPATKSALRFLPHLAAGIAVTGLILAAADRFLSRPIPCACGLAAVLLLVLDQNRHHLSPTTLRAAADLCLLTPLLILLRLHA